MNKNKQKLNMSELTEEWRLKCRDEKEHVAVSVSDDCIEIQVWDDHSYLSSARFTFQQWQSATKQVKRCLDAMTSEVPPRIIDPELAVDGEKGFKWFWSK